MEQDRAIRDDSLLASSPSEQLSGNAGSQGAFPERACSICAKSQVTLPSNVFHCAWVTSKQRRAFWKCLSNISVGFHSYKLLTKPENTGWGEPLCRIISETVLYLSYKESSGLHETNRKGTSGVLIKKSRLWDSHDTLPRSDPVFTRAATQEWTIATCVPYGETLLHVTSVTSLTFLWCAFWNFPRTNEL